MLKKFLLWGLFLGVTAVIMGAFAAHALKQYLSVEQQNSFETGLRYQMYHALLLIILANFKFLQSKAILNLIIIGVFLFSFSIYLLNLRGLFEIESLRLLGPITPIGGLLIISSWTILIVKVFQHKKEL